MYEAALNFDTNIDAWVWIVVSDRENKTQNSFLCEIKILKIITRVTKVNKIKGNIINQELKVRSVLEQIQSQQMWWGLVIRSSAKAWNDKVSMV